MARRLGRAPSQTAAMLVDEGLRRDRFPLVEMRDTAAGRVAYIKGHRLPVWMMAERMWGGETPEQVAEDLGVPASMMAITRHVHRLLNRSHRIESA